MMITIKKSAVFGALALLAFGAVMACPPVRMSTHPFEVSLQVSDPSWDVFIQKIVLYPKDSEISVFAAVLPKVRGANRPIVIPVVSAAKDVVTLTACDFGKITRNIITRVDASRYAGGADNLKKANPDSGYEIYDVTILQQRKGKMIFSNPFVSFKKSKPIFGPIPGPKTPLPVEEQEAE